MYKKIHFHLDDFEFAQAKKLVSIEGGAQFLAQRDDLFPFIKYNKPVVVRPILSFERNMPIAYLSEKSLKLAFIVEYSNSEVTLSTIKGYPETWMIKHKYILGRVHFFYPYFWFKFILKRHLKSEKYRLIR